MESISYLVRYGDRVREERKKLGMNQLSFYSYLFPNHNKNEENVKKKMHDIENGKQKSLDLTFLMALCEKCDVSADYILGFDSEYRNHEIEYIEAVMKLRKWNKDKNNGADISILDDDYIFYSNDNYDIEAAYNQAVEKQTGKQFLRIINYLFNTEETTGKQNQRKRKTTHHLSILSALYLLCMTKPKYITSSKMHNEDYLKLYYPEYSMFIHEMQIDANYPLTLVGDDNVHYPIDSKYILEQIGKKHLMERIDVLIQQLKND